MVKHFEAPPLTLTVGGHTTTGPVLMIGVYLGQREGGFPIGKDARLDDGLFDTFRAGQIARWELIRHLPGLISGNLPRAHPKLSRGQGATVAIARPVPLCCHLDGEFLCRPEDGVKEIHFAVVPKRLAVECYRPGLYGRMQPDRSV